MPTVEYSTTNYHYIQNDYNRYVYQTGGGEAENFTRQFTGWHYIPNNRWCDFFNPAQWFDLVTNHESVKIKSINCAVMNLIPMTDQVAIQQTSTFLSFNNTLYALAYEDNCMETHCSLGRFAPKPKISMREGVEIAAGDGTVSQKQYLPTYTHYIPKLSGTEECKGYYWDPLTRPSEIMELRPGKNSITFHWEPHGSDAHITYSLMNDFSTTQMTRDDSMTDQITLGDWVSYMNGQITPASSRLEDMYTRQEAAPTPPNPPGRTAFNKKACGQAAIWASQNAYQFPIRNWFIKMIPIFDTKNALLKHEAQVCVHKTITLEVSPRKAAINMPRMDYAWLFSPSAQRLPDDAAFGKVAWTGKVTQIGTVPLNRGSANNAWPGNPLDPSRDCRTEVAEQGE